MTLNKGESSLELGFRGRVSIFFPGRGALQEGGSQAGVWGGANYAIRIIPHIIA